MKNTNVTKKMNNKGFSLVELIIVVAIMAVLIGVLAPQYLKYVEKSRESADLDSYETIVSAIEIYAADPAHVTWTDGTVKCTTSAVIEATGSAKDALVDAGIVDATSGKGTLKMKSKKYGTATVNVKKSTTTGYIEFTCTDNTDLLPAMGR